MRDFCSGAVSFLEAAWSEERGLFSYSTRLVDGAYVQDFAHPSAVRYTVNSLLGLEKARGQDGAGAGFPGEVDRLLERFLAVHGAGLENDGDTGLLAVLLAERRETEALEPLVARLARVATDAPRDRLVLQEVAWMLWGLCAAARAGATAAEAPARALFAALRERYLDRDSLLARHSANRLRRHVVSYGATAYFLRALFEFASTFDDDDVDGLFRRAVERVVAAQGPLGQWPWMIAVRSGLPVDPYPVFSVHQDSMSMLFLLPALERGVEGAREAIDRSLAWLVGHNERGLDLVVPEPFLVYRSFERAEALAKPRRYLRTVRGAAADRPGAYVDGGRLRVNEECRSYHLGWVLYVWSGRPSLPDLAVLREQASARSG